MCYKVTVLPLLTWSPAFFLMVKNETFEGPIHILYLQKDAILYYLIFAMNT